MPRKKNPLAAQEVKPMSLYMPHGLYLRLKTVALREGKPANRLIITAVTEYLKGK